MLLLFTAAAAAVHLSILTSINRTDFPTAHEFIDLKLTELNARHSSPRGKFDKWTEINFLCPPCEIAEIKINTDLDELVFNSFTAIFAFHSSGNRHIFILLNIRRIIFSLAYSILTRSRIGRADRAPRPCPIASVKYVPFDE